MGAPDDFSGVAVGGIVELVVVVEVTGPTGVWGPGAPGLGLDGPVGLGFVVCLVDDVVSSASEVVELEVVLTGVGEGFGSVVIGGFGSVVTGGFGSVVTGGFGSVVTGGFGSVVTGGAGSVVVGGTTGGLGTSLGVVGPSGVGPLGTVTGGARLSNARALTLMCFTA